MMYLFCNSETNNYVVFGDDKRSHTKWGPLRWILSDPMHSHISTNYISLNWDLIVNGKGDGMVLLLQHENISRSLIESDYPELLL